MAEDFNIIDVTPETIHDCLIIALAMIDNAGHMLAQKKDRTEKETILIGVVAVARNVTNQAVQTITKLTAENN